MTSELICASDPTRNMETS